MTEERSYAEELDRCVSRAFVEGANTLEAICRKCAGAFPTEVLAAIERLQQNSSFQFNDAISGVKVDLRHHLPDPHPADYEWRFTRETAAYLARYIEALGGRIACLGTPTVYAALKGDGRDAVLIDRNPFLHPLLVDPPHKTSLVADLTKDLPSDLGTFDVVVMDPPWYSSHFESWLDNALKLVVPGASIITSMFPPLTRPEAKQERAKLIELLSSIGELSTPPFAAHYETPLFESESLAALGVPRLISWRVGELIHLGCRTIHPPRQLATPVEPLWHRFLFGTEVVAIRDDPLDRNATLQVSSIYPEGYYLLRSVSARDPFRSEIDLWTSSNRCLKLAGRARLVEALEQLYKGTTPSDLLDNFPQSTSERESLALVFALIGW